MQDEKKEDRISRAELSLIDHFNLRDSNVDFMHVGEGNMCEPDYDEPSSDGLFEPNDRYSVEISLLINLDSYSKILGFIVVDNGNRLVSAFTFDSKCIYKGDF